MKAFIVPVFAALAAVSVTGCGGAAEVGDSSHLTTPEAEQKAQEAAARYESVGKGGPPAAGSAHSAQ